MPLQFRKINARSLSALQQVTQRLSPAAQPVMRTIGAVFPINEVAYDASQPAYPMYLLGINDVLNPQTGLDAAKQTGWLYIISPDMTATVAGEDSGDSHTFSSFTSGPLAAAITQQVSELSHNASLSGITYEICLLNLPALHLVALWLKTGTAVTADDLLLPLLSAQPLLPVGHSFSVSEFFSALQAPAALALRASL